MNWREVEERFGLLPLREQMLLLGRLYRKMRESACPDADPVENERLLDEMAHDPAIQRELRLGPRPAKSGL